ncbi:MAG: hypothetical protein AAF490_30490 [Chloroflexota bacterium]
MSELTSTGQSVYQPTPQQLERTRALKRFNLLFVYLPIGLFTAIVLVVMGFLVWLTFGGRAESTLTAVSGMADLILILILIPLVAIGLLGPISLGGLIYWLVQQRKKKQESDPPQQGNLVQRFTWQVETRSDTFLSKFQDILAKAVQPIIQFNAWLESIERAVQRLINRSVEE